MLENILDECVYGPEVALLLEESLDEIILVGVATDLEPDCNLAVSFLKCFRILGTLVGRSQG